MGIRRTVACIALFLLSADFAWAQVTRRISVNPAGDQAEGHGNWSPSLSADGRWVVFDSTSGNLVPGDTNGIEDVFVADRQSGAIECATVDPSGTPVGGYLSSISPDGRFVTFISRSPDILPGLTGTFEQLFVRDRSSQATELVSVDPSGAEGDGRSYTARMTADGRWVVFASTAHNLVPGGWNGDIYQVLVRDRQNGTTELASAASDGTIADDNSWLPSISRDGRFVAFSSGATDLVPGDVNGTEDVFLRDRQTGSLLLVSLGAAGVQGDGPSSDPRVSADGRWIAFQSTSTNLVPGDTNGCLDVFVRDLQNATTERVSVDSNGIEANGHSWLGEMSADGRYIAFVSLASNLCADDTNGKQDIFLRDRQLDITERVDVSSGGAQTQGDTPWDGDSSLPSVTDDGRCVSFESQAVNLVPWDTNGQDDIFIRDRMPGSETTAFTSLCLPGSGSVIACPCSNPPSGPDRGCDNSDATGGASLSAAGDTELSADGLTLTASGMRSSSLSVLAQGSALLSNGLVYGQGVRCAGGQIRRLYNRSAQGGAATFPNFQAGESPISVRSAQKGDSILPGQSRWYIVYYRDPSVLGGCPATSTFNTTQTGQLDWSL